MATVGTLGTKRSSGTDIKRDVPITAGSSVSAGGETVTASDLGFAYIESVPASATAMLSDKSGAILVGLDVSSDGQTLTLSYYQSAGSAADMAEATGDLSTYSFTVSIEGRG